MLTKIYTYYVYYLFTVHYYGVKVSFNTQNGSFM